MANKETNVRSFICDSNQTDLGSEEKIALTKLSSTAKKSTVWSGAFADWHSLCFLCRKEKFGARKRCTLNSPHASCIKTAILWQLNPSAFHDQSQTIFAFFSAEIVLRCAWIHLQELSKSQQFFSLFMQPRLSGIITFNKCHLQHLCLQHEPNVSLPCCNLRSFAHYATCHCKLALICEKLWTQQSNWIQNPLPLKLLLLPWFASFLVGFPFTVLPFLVVFPLLFSVCEHGNTEL